jgi:hypothetical protein
LLFGVVHWLVFGLMVGWLGVVWVGFVQLVVTWLVGWLLFGSSVVVVVVVVVVWLFSLL